MSAPLRPYVVAGELVACSGQVGSKDGVLVGPSIGEQTTQALANLAATLAVEGLGLGDLVKVNGFLIDPRDLDEYNAAYAAAFEGLPLPARSSVGVAWLPSPGARVEIEGWAYRAPAE